MSSNNMERVVKKDSIISLKPLISYLITMAAVAIIPLSHLRYLVFTFLFPHNKHRLQYLSLYIQLFPHAPHISMFTMKRWVLRSVLYPMHGKGHFAFLSLTRFPTAHQTCSVAIYMWLRVE